MKRSAACWMLTAALLAGGCKKPAPPATGVDLVEFRSVQERIDRDVAAWVVAAQFDRGEDQVFVAIPVFEREGVLLVGQAEAIAHIRGSVSRESWRGPKSAEDLLGGVDVHARQRIVGVPREELGPRLDQGFADFAKASHAKKVPETVAAVERLLEVTDLDFWHGDAPLWMKRAALGDWVITVVRDDERGLGLRIGSKTVGVEAVHVRAITVDDVTVPLVVMHKP